MFIYSLLLSFRDNNFKYVKNEKIVYYNSQNVSIYRLIGDLEGPNISSFLQSYLLVIKSVLPGLFCRESIKVFVTQIKILQDF